MSQQEKISKLLIGLGTMGNEMRLYVIAPKGYEERFTLVVAHNVQDAVEKAKTYPTIQEVVEQGAELAALDVAAGFFKLGYSIAVTHTSDSVH